MFCNNYAKFSKLEIILFTSTHDFLFWVMIGLAMHEANIYQEKNVKNNK